MRKIVILFLVCFIILLGCEKKPNYCGIECLEADMSEYISLKDVEHVFLEVNYEEALELLKEETYTGILFYGYPSCPWCEDIVSLINEEAKNLNLKIHYINKKSEFNLNHPQLEEETEKYLSKYINLDLDEEGKPHLFVPEVIVVKEGKIVDHHLGTLDNHDASERELSESEKDKLINIYQNMFKKIQ